MTPEYLIEELCQYALNTSLIEESDLAYARNSLLSLMKLSDTDTPVPQSVRPLHEILSELCDVAYEKGLIEENTVTYRDLFDTALMGSLVARPSTVIENFERLYKESPESATDYFYALAKNSNYVRVNRIARDLKWTVNTEYGEIDVTVNLSKPEKDPKAIAMARLQKPSGYPKCLLCHENEGYMGALSKPARQNLRQIPFTMAGEEWFIQYSPYVYYNEHCIALSKKHTPMKIDRNSFEKLLGFVEHFPHYFIGSNADLPIVGGSILSHDHMQGGHYTFSMERAEIDTPLTFSGFEDVEAGIVRWPMSVIRLRCADKERLVNLADKILIAWRGYTDESAFVFANTNGEPHSTITPIARMGKDKRFEVDLVLRNNITTEEHPLGVYHPHERHHNIKKENIGLIEVMGLAVLPARLKDEIAEMKSAILSGVDFAELESIKKHKAWFEAFKDNYTFTEENTEDILKAEIGKTFKEVLVDAGVFKRTEKGMADFMRFVKSVGGKKS